MPDWRGVEPSELVETWAPKAPKPRALVLGAGGGGDALWLAKSGFEVDAVERDPARARMRIEEPLKGSITVHVEDLATYPIPPDRYGLVVALAVFHFVVPSRLRLAAPGIEAGLCRGGLLLVQVLSTDDPGLHAMKQAGADEVEPNTFYISELGGIIHFFEADELRVLFGGLEELVLERYRWAKAADDEGFGAGMILVGRRPAKSGPQAAEAAKGADSLREESGG